MNNNSVKWLSAVIGRGKIYIGLLLVLQAVNGISSVIYAMLLKQIIDNAVSGNKRGFIAYFLGTVGLVCLQLILRAATRSLTEYTHSTYENALKKRLFGQLMQRDLGQVTASHSADWLNRLTSDTVVCANGATDIIPGLAGMVVKIVGALGMLIFIEPRFMIIFIPGGAAVLLMTYAIRKTLKRLHKVIQEKDGLLRELLQERIESLAIVRAFAVEKDSLADAEVRMNDHRDARMKRVFFSNISNTGFGAATNGMYLIGLAYGGFKLLSGSITYGTVTAILQLISQVQMPFATITGYLPQFYAMTASAERLIEAEEFEDDSSEPISREEISRLYTNELLSFGLDKAVFSYKSADRNPLVLKDLSIEIKKGGFTAITGHSGCGKSTMIKLFMCLYRLDGGERFLVTDQRREMGPEYRRLFAYVPQGNHLMSGTIREVVTISDRSAAQDKERLERALKIACADEFVWELEKGADTMLGEKGQGLSEGQMQRLAVARAIFSEAPVLLLDEATSALDDVTEARLLENLRSMTDKTVLIVTHRPKALELCDTIVRMTEEGLTVEEKK